MAGFYDDPTTMALLGMGAGFAKGSAPSRLPVPLSLALGGGAEGLAEGGKAYLANQQQEAQTANQKIEGQAKLLPLNVQRQLFGMSPIGADGAPQAGGGAGPQMPDPSTMSPMAKKLAGYQVQPAEWDAAAAGYVPGTKEYQDYMRTAAMHQAGRDPMLDRGSGILMAPDINNPGAPMAPVSTHAIPVPGTRVDPATGNLAAPDPTNMAAIGGAAQAHETGTMAGTPRTPTVDPSGAEVRQPGSMADFLKDPAQVAANPQRFIQYIQNGTGEGGPLDSMSPFARAVSYGEGNNPKQNPNSTASGFGQFLDKTWISAAKAKWPQQFAGVPDQMIAKMKTIPELAGPAIDAYAAQNATEFAKAGLVPDTASLLLAHKFGAAGAMKLLKADPASMASDTLGQEATAANPNLAFTPVQKLLDQAKTVAGPIDSKGAPGPGLQPGPAAASQPVAVAQDPLSKAVAAEQATNYIPPNTVKAPEFLGKRQEAAAKDQTEIDGAAENARQMQNTTQTILRVLANPTFDPKAATAALLPLANSLIAAGFPQAAANSLINVGSAQELEKNYTAMVSAQVKALGERAARAMELQEKGMPNGGLQKAPQVLMVNSIDQIAQQAMDTQKAFKDWMTHPGNKSQTAQGFDTWFNEQNPIEKYTAKAYANAQKQYGQGLNGADAQQDVLFPTLIPGDPRSKAFRDALPPGTRYRDGKTGKITIVGTPNAQ